MKPETLKQGYDLHKQIEAIQTAREYLGDVTEIPLQSPSKTYAKIRLTTKLTYFDQCDKMPKELTEQLTEEFIRCIVRCKRHLDTWERKLNEEFEDL